MRNTINAILENLSLNENTQAEIVFINDIRNINTLTDDFKKHYDNLIKSWSMGNMADHKVIYTFKKNLNQYEKDLISTDPSVKSCKWL